MRSIPGVTSWAARLRPVSGWASRPWPPHTARLPLAELRTPENALGRDTASAIRVGTVLGHRMMIEGVLGHLRRELAVGAGIAPHQVRAVLTGGLSSLPWAHTIEGLDGIDPDLTLKGLVHLHVAVAGDEAQA